MPDYASSTRSFRVSATDQMTHLPRMFGANGAVASEHYLSAQAGIDILKAGGNAVDAACAATLVEGLVNQNMHSFGGEVPMLIARPNDPKVYSVNGNMVAPELATVAAFKKRGFDEIPASGVLAAGVPGAPGAIVTALKAFGSKSFAEIADAAIAIAKGGYPAHSGLIRQHMFGIAVHAERFRTEWPGSAALYLPGDEIPVDGQIIKNPAYAATLQYMADEERHTKGTREARLDGAFNAFYKGDIATTIDSFVRERDGFLRRSDLERFEVPIETPKSVAFEGVQVHKCGFWNQGPAMLQTLQILKTTDLKAMGHNSSEYIHTVVEAMKLAYADREQYYGDPDFVDVPGEALLSEAYGKLRAALLDGLSVNEIRPGDPVNGAALLDPSERLGGRAWGPGTVHVDVGDRHGGLAAFTPSGAWIKSSEVVPDLGFPLGNRLSNFYLTPDHHPNVLAPFKRPCTTISPTLVTKDGDPWLAFGSMGGDQQDQWQLQFLLNRVLFDMPVQAAIEAPKFSSEHFSGLFAPHDFYLGRLRAEETLGDQTLAAVKQRGHDLDVGPAWSEGFLCAVERDPDTGTLEAGADPRGTKSEVFPATALAY